MCSISGFVSSVFAVRRTRARSSALVSPSYVAATREGTSHSRSDRSWSWASAFVGNTSSAVAASPRSALSTIGTWYPRDFPDAVPVASTTWRPWRSASMARTWCV